MIWSLFQFIEETKNLISCMSVIIWSSTTRNILQTFEFVAGRIIKKMSLILKKLVYSNKYL